MRTQRTPGTPAQPMPAAIHHNGQRVAAGWGAVLAEAQQERAYFIEGQAFARIPYGRDYAGKMSTAASCRDCATARGELHVVMCWLEQCPRCGAQAIACYCEHDDRV